MSELSKNHYHVGERIHHPNYGEGTVLEIVGDDAVRVEFDEHGVYYLMPKKSREEAPGEAPQLNLETMRLLVEALGDGPLADLFASETTA